MKLLPNVNQKEAQRPRASSPKRLTTNRKETHKKLHANAERHKSSSGGLRKSGSALTAFYKALKVGVSNPTLTTALKTLTDEHRAVQGLSKRRGRAKGGGQSSKAKGRAAVVLTRQALIDAYDLGDDDIFVKATSQGGCDVHLSPHALKSFPFGIETKCSESLSIWRALAQAKVNADKKGLPLVLFFKRASTPLFVVFVAKDVLPYLKRK